jgi:hypothetical protein
MLSQEITVKRNLKKTIPDNCFYDFTDTGCNNVVNYFGSSSAWHCQYSCSTTASCNSFMFDKVSRTCYLKDTLGCNATNVNRISGPKTCGYMAGNTNEYTIK